MAVWEKVGTSCFVAAVMEEGFIPLYRYRNRVSQHYYTIDNNDPLAVALKKEGDEGIACYIKQSPSEGFVPFFRLNHPNNGSFFYTAREEERRDKQREGYIDSNIVLGYVLTTPNNPVDVFIQFLLGLFGGGQQRTLRNYFPLLHSFNSGLPDHFYTISQYEWEKAAEKPIKCANDSRFWCLPPHTEVWVHESWGNSRVYYEILTDGAPREVKAQWFYNYWLWQSQGEIYRLVHNPNQWQNFTQSDGWKPIKTKLKIINDQNFPVRIMIQDAEGNNPTVFGPYPLHPEVRF